MKTTVIYCARCEVELEVPDGSSNDEILMIAEETPIPINDMEDAVWSAHEVLDNS